MDEDELRTKIWDMLFRSGDAMSIADIARQLNCEQDHVQRAVNHEWFQLKGEMVTVAY